MSSYALRFVFALLTVTSMLQATELPVYVGTYTNGDSEGIYLLDFDSNSGELKLRGVAAKTSNPSFLALHPEGEFLYAVNETNTGEISAFRIAPKTGKLTLINDAKSGGAHPCHLSIDSSGKYVLVANYTGGNVSSTKINADGSLGKQVSLLQHAGSSVNEKRQQEPHAHSINLTPDNQFAIAADLGTDELLVYDFGRTGKLKKKNTTKLAPGSGPRHFSFHPDGKHAYAINELLSTVTVLEYDTKEGSLKELQTITTLPRDFEGDSFTAEVRVSPDGKFVYGSNRGHDSIAVFRVNSDHRLTLLQIEKMGGKTPRNFNLDPTGKFLLAAGQASHDIQVFKIDPQLGKLTKTEHSIKIPNPVCIRFGRLD